MDTKAFESVDTRTGGQMEIEPGLEEAPRERTEAQVDALDELRDSSEDDKWGLTQDEHAEMSRVAANLISNPGLTRLLAGSIASYSIANLVDEHLKRGLDISRKLAEYANLFDKEKK